MDAQGTSKRLLIETFFTDCEKNFRFLEQKHAYDYLSGLAEYRKNYKVIVPYHYSKIDLHNADELIALTRYELGGSAVEISFSIETLRIEGHIYYDPVQRFEFSEVITAAKKGESRLNPESGLSQRDLIQDKLCDMGRVFQKYKKYFIEPKPRFVERVHTIKNKRMEHAIRSHFMEQLSDRCIQAARAYTEKNFKRVIELLQPFEPYLGQAETKKLVLARKQLLEQKT